MDMWHEPTDEISEAMRRVEDFAFAILDLATDYGDYIESLADDEESEAA